MLQKAGKLVVVTQPTLTKFPGKGVREWEKCGECEGVLPRQVVYNSSSAVLFTNVAAWLWRNSALWSALCCVSSSLSVCNNHTWAHTARQTISATHAHSLNQQKRGSPTAVPCLIVEACYHFAYQDYNPIATWEPTSKCPPSSFQRSLTWQLLSPQTRLLQHSHDLLIFSSNLRLISFMLNVVGIYLWSATHSEK